MARGDTKRNIDPEETLDRLTKSSYEGSSVGILLLGFLRRN